MDLSKILQEIDAEIERLEKARALLAGQETSSKQIKSLSATWKRLVTGKHAPTAKRSIHAKRRGDFVARSRKSTSVGRVFWKRAAGGEGTGDGGYGKPAGD